jgi:hypothetical protein
MIDDGVSIMLSAPDQTVFDAITDFLASSDPTPDAILAYRLPAELEQRAHYLLERRRDDTLTRDEEFELFDFIRADDLMTLLKAKTRLKFNWNLTLLDGWLLFLRFFLTFL